MAESVLGVEIRYYSLEFFCYGKEIETFSVKVEGTDPNRYFEAFKKGLKRLGRNTYGAICFVGENKTYIFEDDREIEGESTAGKKALDEVLNSFSEKTFKEEIGMLHPSDNAYPLPRLLYIRRYFRNDFKVAKIKDRLIERLTGYCVSDPYTWVGLINPKTQTYSEPLIEKYVLSVLLPTIEKPDYVCFEISDAMMKELGLRTKPLIINGCDTFTSYMIGMGLNDDVVVDIPKEKEIIAIKGKTISNSHYFQTRPYLEDNVLYGKHISYEQNMKRSGSKPLDPSKVIDRNPPICLPYWNGMSYPIMNANAYGSYIGGKAHDNEALSYSSLEGNAFASYQIYSTFNKNKKAIVMPKGQDKNLALLKSSLFDVPVYETNIDKDHMSSFGAVLLGYSALNHKKIEETQKELIVLNEIAKPDKELGDKLKARFETFKEAVDREYGASL